MFSQGLSYGNAVGGSNDYYSSIHWSGIVTATTSNQVLSITTEQEASAGSITVPTGFLGSIFIKEIPNDDVIVLSGRHLASTTNWSITLRKKYFGILVLSMIPSPSPMQQHRLQQWEILR